MRNKKAMDISEFKPTTAEKEAGTKPQEHQHRDMSLSWINRQGSDVPPTAQAPVPALAPGDVLMEIPVAAIRANRFQVRTKFNEESIRSLAESIKENNLVQPIVVYADKPKGGQGGEESYELVAGERRWRAHKELGRKTIRAIVRQKNDDRLLRVHALLENVQREDLPLIDKANAIMDLTKQFGTREEVAKALGFSKRLIQMYLAVGRADAFYKSLIAQNDLDIRKSRQLLSIAKRIENEGNSDKIAAFQSALGKQPVDGAMLMLLTNKFLRKGKPSKEADQNRPDEAAGSSSMRFRRSSTGWGKTIQVGVQKDATLSDQDIEILAAQLEEFLQGLPTTGRRIKLVLEEPPAQVN